jgi:hypothetical protein
MTRRGPGRLPGDPRPGDRGFGAAGGFVDDVFFWVRDRARSAELEQDRLGRAGRLSEPPSRIARLLGALRRH